MKLNENDENSNLCLGKVGLVFCSLYTLTYRTTWIVFPFSILALCWTYISDIFSCCNTRIESTENVENDSQITDPELAEFEAEMA